MSWPVTEVEYEWPKVWHDPCIVITSIIWRLFTHRRHFPCFSGIYEIGWIWGQGSKHWPRSVSGARPSNSIGFSLQFFWIKFLYTSFTFSRLPVIKKLWTQNSYDPDPQKGSHPRHFEVHFGVVYIQGRDKGILSNDTNGWRRVSRHFRQAKV